ncbi:MAG: lysylphosphatidylglycerol synthase transmembrane domain-containing protein [Thermoanaerobaculia bacterium]
MKRVAFGLALGVLILFWISRQVDVGAVIDSLANASPALLALALACVFLALWLKGERWAVAIAAGSGEFPRRRLFSSMLIGMAGNIAMPARVGDFVRAFVLRKHNGVPVTQAITASWSVQVLDFLVVAVLLWALAPVKEFASRSALAAVAVVAVGAMLGLAFVRRFPTVLRPLERLPPWATRRLKPILESAHHGLAFLDSARAMGSVVGLTVLVWIAEAVAITAGLRAFGLVPALAAGPLLAAAIGLSFVLPLTPGSLGTYQLASILVLGAYGIDRAEAFAFGLGYQAVSQISVLVAGFLALQREGLSLRRLAAGQEASGKTGAAK